MKFYKKTLIVILTLLSTSLFAETYMKSATVSFYADDFHGKKTSNGEIFNMYALTCASKTLPFDTELKITNLKNGKSVIVRVNDRGPFVPDRELDLSKAAAVKLDMVKSGTAKVQIDIVKLGPNTKISQQTAAKAKELMDKRFGPNWNKSPAVAKTTGGTDLSGSKHAASNKKTVDSAPAGSKFEIQVASFSTKENAQKASKKLYDSGIKNIFIRSNGEIFRVVIKNLSKSELVKTEETLKKIGYKEYIIRIGK